MTSSHSRYESICKINDLPNLQIIRDWESVSGKLAKDVMETMPLIRETTTLRKMSEAVNSVTEAGVGFPVVALVDSNGILLGTIETEQFAKKLDEAVEEAHAKGGTRTTIDGVSVTGGTAKRRSSSSSLNGSITSNTSDSPTKKTFLSTYFTADMKEDLTARRERRKMLKDDVLDDPINWWSFREIYGAGKGGDFFDVGAKYPIHYTATIQIVQQYFLMMYLQYVVVLKEGRLQGIITVDGLGKWLGQSSRPRRQSSDFREIQRGNSFGPECEPSPGLDANADDLEDQPSSTLRRRDRTNTKPDGDLIERTNEIEAVTSNINRRIGTGEAGGLLDTSAV